MNIQNKIALCATSEMLSHPKYMGLDINLNEFKDQKWLIWFSNGRQARRFCLNDKNLTEVWLISSDDIDAVNLAAAIKKDNPNLRVCLIAFEMSGSLKSRAASAKIDAVLSKTAFIERFNAFKNMHSMRSKSVHKQVIKPVQNTNQDKLMKSRSKGFLLPIVSASGGSGKSTIAIMTAILSQLSGNRTLLLDASLQFSEIDRLIEVKNSIHIDELISSPELSSKLEPTETLPAVLKAPSSPELAENIMCEIPKLIDSLRGMYDCIVVNTCSYWNELIAGLLENASKVLLVIDQRPTSISSTKQAIDLCSRCGIATSSFLFAINHCKKGALYSAVDVSCALEGAPVAEIVEGGIEVDNSYMKRNPISLIESRNPFALSVWNVVNTLIPNNSKNTSVEMSKNNKAAQGRTKRKFTLRKAVG